MPGQRGEPGAARRQLGSPRTQGCQGVRAQAPAQHDRVVAGLAHACGDHEARRLLPRREVDDAGPGARREDGAEDQERRDDRAQARGLAGRRRRHRLHVHEQEGAVRLLRRADRRRLQDRRDVLTARQGDHDEGVAPHRVRPRGEDLLQGRLRQAPEAVRRAGCRRQQRPVRSLRQDRVAARLAARRDHPRPARLPRAPARAGHGGFGQGHHQLPLTQ